jgi:alkylation response protein AidB-like acyl-CoA dehydrogenase
MREQFGQPIGSFQAVKHRCADMAVRASAGWTQTLYASLAAQEKLADILFQTTAALLVSCDAAVRNAAANVQNHGGMGYTREVDAHHYVKLAQIFDKIAGDMRHHRRVMLALPAPDFASPEN